MLVVTHRWRGWHHLTQMLSHDQTPFSLSDNMKLYMCPAALGLSFAPLKLLGEVRQQLSFLSHIFGDQAASYLHREDRAADNLQLWLTLLAPRDFKYIVFNIHWREWSVSWNSFGSIAARVSTTRKNGRIDLSQLLARCWRIQLRKTYMRRICDEWKIRLTCQCSNDWLTSDQRL